VSVDDIILGQLETSMRFLVLLLVVASGTTAAAQSKTDSNRYLDSQWTAFENYAKDFLQFEESQQAGSIEHENADDLEKLALDTAEFLGATSTLLTVYDDVCPTDRAKITAIIKLSISHYVQEIDLNIKAVNNNLAYTKVPALAVTGDRMKKDLRDVRERLASLRDSLKP
jgi:hypothetical protein